ncbi:MAG: SoxR reducing system RseC family protein [Bacteroidales bacterium]|nr:SoxR reducing system RseC family protein [Bacteroidales bacterium]
MDNLICHEGIVEALNSETVFVRIIQVSACSSCHAKGACSTSDISEKLIEIRQSDEKFSIGERVTIEGSSSIASSAVLLAFVIPFVLIILTLALSTHFFQSEVLSALLSILILIPYYSVLYFRNDVLKKTFAFRLKHINSSVQ